MATNTLVVVFTDLVGSTSQRVLLGDDIADGLRREHDALVRDATTPRGGTFIKSTGDGALLTFPSAASAIDAVVEVQRRLAERNATAAHRFEVRIGLTAGEVSIEDDDVFGMPVNESARLCDAADTGQILVSREVRSLAGSRCSTPMVLAGELVLKGLAEPIEAWAVVWTDDAPTAVKGSVTTVGAVTGSLPEPPTSFVGRLADLAALEDVVKVSRLVTLLGPGGIGKTRLSIAFGQRQQGVYADGVWFVDLSNLTDDRAISTHVLRTMGVGDAPDVTSREQLVRHLAGREVLLIIDNCEHVVAAVAEIVDGLLRGTTHTTILTTSRERLQVPGEVVWQVPTIGAGGDDAAAELFAARVASIGGRLTDADRQDVTDLCDLLDGLPLAIELAAARCRSMPPGTVLQRLRARPDAALGSNRTGPERQRTVEGLVAWSVDLLDDRERDLFARLGVFSGSFPLEAAERVCTCEDLDEFDVLDLMAQLVDKSLVTTVPDAEGRLRYRLLFTIRAHAAGLLDPAKADELAERLIAWLTARFQEGTAGLQGPEQRQWYAELSSDHELLRGAVRARCDPLDTARRALADAAAYHWWFAGHHREADALLAGLLDDSAGPVPLDQAAALHAWRAEILYELTRDDASQEQAEAAAAALAEADAAGAPVAAETRWLVGFASGHLGRGPGELLQAVALARSNGWDHREARALSRHLQILGFRGDPKLRLERAAANARAVELASRLADPRLSGDVAANHRWTASLDRDTEGALAIAEAAVVATEGAALPWIQAFAVRDLADSRRRTGDLEGGLRDAERAQAMMGATDLPMLRWRVDYPVSFIKVCMGRFDEAIAAFEPMLVDETIAGSRHMRGNVLNCLTVSYAMTGRHADADRAYRTLHEMAAAAPSYGWALWSGPYFAYAVGDDEAAVVLAEASMILGPMFAITERWRLDDMLTRAHERLTPERLAELEERGRSLDEPGFNAIVGRLLDGERQVV